LINLRLSAQIFVLAKARTNIAIKEEVFIEELAFKDRLRTSYRANFGGLDEKNSV
jgi:hypothetical protein